MACHTSILPSSMLCNNVFHNVNKNHIQLQWTHLGIIFVVCTWVRATSNTLLDRLGWALPTNFPSANDTIIRSQDRMSPSNMHCKKDQMPF